MTSIMIGGYAGRQVLTRFNVGELDNLHFIGLADCPDLDFQIQVAETVDWAYFRDTKTERVCKVRRDEVSIEEDQDTFNKVFEFFLPS